MRLIKKKFGSIGSRITNFQMWQINNFQNRNRTCNNPETAFGGTFCIGQSDEQDDCNPQSCAAFFQGEHTNAGLPCYRGSIKYLDKLNLLKLALVVSF